MTLPRRSLKPGPMIWNHFLKSRLMPSTHDSTVNKDRAVLLFAICEGKAINVGNIIKEQISVCANRQSGGLWFPSLITKLCLAQGVKVSSEEEKHKITGHITMAAITRILQEKAKAAEEEEPSSNPIPEAHPQEQFTSGSGSSFLQLEQRLSQMEVMQYESLQMMKDFWKYERDRDLALQKHYRANSKRFHSFPAFPKHLCDSSAEESEPENGDGPEAVASSPAEEEAPEAPAMAPATTRAKGKAAMTTSTAKKSVLRSAANWKWSD